MPSEALSYPINSMQMAETVVVETTIAEVMQVDPTSWVDEHGDYLFRYALIRLRNETAAEDCVQEALLAAIQNLKSYGGKSSERTWLTAILKHKIIDCFRRSAREQPFDDFETDISGFENFFNQSGRWKDHWHNDFEPTDWRISPEAAIQETQFMKTLQQCLGKLPDRVAGVFTLRELDELSAGEICEILQLSASNFWVMMHRARMGLRRCMELNWFKAGYR